MFMCGSSSFPRFGELAMAVEVLSTSGVKCLISNVKLVSTNIVKTRNNSK